MHLGQHHTSPRRRADLTFLLFMVIGITVTLIVALLGRNVLLGLAVGFAPGLILGGIAWWRISRGGCGGCQFCPLRRPGSCGLPAE